MELYDYLQDVKKDEQAKFGIPCLEAGTLIFQLITGVNFLHQKNILHSYLNST